MSKAHTALKGEELSHIQYQQVIILFIENNLMGEIVVGAA